MLYGFDFLNYLNVLLFAMIVQIDILDVLIINLGPRPVSIIITLHLITLLLFLAK